MADRAAAARAGWRNHCAGTSRSQMHAAGKAKTKDTKSSSSGASKPTTKASKAGPKSNARPAPVAMRHLDVRTLDPLANPDVHDLEYVYGRGHVGAALDQYSIGALRDTAYSMGISKPGRTKREVIASILRAHRQGKRAQKTVYRPSR